MANEQNLVSLGDRPQRERNEIAKMGAKASNEKQKEKKLLREYAELLLSLPADKRKFGKNNIPDDMKDNKMLLVKALFDRALTGDVHAAKELRSIIGEDVALPAMHQEDDGLFEAIGAAVEGALQDREV